MSISWCGCGLLLQCNLRTAFCEQIEDFPPPSFVNQDVLIQMNNEMILILLRRWRGKNGNLNYDKAV